MVWFKEVLDVDENGEVTYLEDESRQWKRKEEWYGYEGNENGPYQYVHIEEKKFKTVIIENYQPIKSNDH